MAHMSRNSTLFPRMRTLCLSVLCVLPLLSVTATRAAAAVRAVPVEQIRDSFPCRAFLDWMPDPGGKQDIQEAGSPARREDFTPLDAPGATFPPRTAGALWLRLTLGPRSPEIRPQALLLDMGDGLPGLPVLFVPQQKPFAESPEWQDVAPGRRNVFLLPEARMEPLTLYIRLEGLPDPWFAPVLRTPHNAATAPERMAYPAALTALGAAALLCLLRGLSERGQWRLWTGLYTAASLIYALWGMPAAPGGSVPVRELPGVLAPGIALMLLPHVGRHLMRTRTAARALDIQYMLLSLPGALAALLPLVPGFAWTSHYLAFWPAATALFIPTSLGAWLSGLPGARRFLLACLAPPLGAAAGAAGAYLAFPSPLLAAAPLLGVALGALLIAGTSAPGEYLREEESSPLPSGRNAPEPAPADTAGAEADAPPRPETQDRALSLILPADSARKPDTCTDAPAPAFSGVDPEEPGLRLLPAEEFLPEESGTSAAHPSRAGAADARPSEELRPLLDSLLRESAGINLCALPPAARQHADALHAIGRDLAALADTLWPQKTRNSREHRVFDLQHLLREAHHQVAGEAERKALSISWFMPPHLPQYYYGNAEELALVMRLLLESAISASQKGFVQIAVRRVPESVNPGHLLFSVSDTGSGMSPKARNPLAAIRAWELAGEHGGSFSTESDAHASSINFSLHLAPQPAPAHTQPAQRQARVIIADGLTGSRGLLAFFLEGLPCTVLEARSLEEALRLCAEEKTDLLLLDRDMPEAGNPEALTALRKHETEAGLEPMPVLALESPESARGEGALSGEHVHSLPKPVTRGGLREAVQRLLRLEETNAETDTDLEDPDGEEPLDLPPPVIYGPGRLPEEQHGSFVPLSLDQRLDLAVSAPALPRASEQRPPVLPLLTASLPPAAAESQTGPAPAAPDGSSGRQSGAAADAPSGEKPAPFPTSLDQEWIGGHTPFSRDPVLVPFDRRASASSAEEMPPEAARRETPAAEDGLAQGALLDWVSGVKEPAEPRLSAEPHEFIRQADPSASLSIRDAMRFAEEEWVGEPMPVQRQNAAPAVWGRSAAPADTLEWVGEPTPVTRIPQTPPLRAASPPQTRRHAEQHTPERRTTGGDGHSAPAVWGRAAAPADALEWVGEPMPVPGRPAAPAGGSERTGKPAFQERPHPQSSGQSSFIPLRLTKAPPLSVRADAPETPVPIRESSASGASAVEQMRPLIPGLLASLDEALDDVRRGVSGADAAAVEEAAARIAAQADNYGLRILARMARCVESAAQARDGDALINILPDLENAVERNRIALMPKRRM